MKKAFDMYGHRLLTLALALLVAAGMIVTPDRASAAERELEEYVFTDYVEGYHLKSFLNGYNVLAFGNVYLGLHCMGALLVQGDYDGSSSNSGFADGENMPPSYIKGHFNAPNSVYNSRNNRVDPLYVGSGNTVSTWTDWNTTYYYVNGVGTGNNNTTPVYVSDNFFNFPQAYAVIRKNQETMQQGSTAVTPDAKGWITVEIGSNVSIASLEGVKVINLVGDLHAQASTTINVLDGGDLNVPMQYVNGVQPPVVEQAEEGTSIVWNFPDAESILLPTQNWIGHVIAPDADVSQMSGNYNGCIICRNLYSSAEGHLYNYASDDTSWMTVFSVQKIWNDGNDADGLRPDHINVHLLANGRPYGKAVRLEEKTGWYYVWTDLPETDDRGNKITYSVQEDRVRGYTSEYDEDTQTLINTHEYETVDISGRKTWRNEQAWGWGRPWSITVRLYADGREVASQVVNTAYWGGVNSYVFRDLPKYSNGREIVYTIKEDPVPGYSSEVDGYDLINTFGSEQLSISGTKRWDDSNDADGIRPDEVVVQLLANGKVVEEQYAAANTGWEFTFTNLPEYDAQGDRITYTVREKTTPRGYTVTVDGYDIINTHKPETTSVSGSKTWNDDNDNDGKRPGSITVILLANMAEVARKTVTAADGWRWTFTDLPRNYAGSPIRYSVTEVVTEDYASRTAGMNLINTHENETIDLSGAKTWEDNDNADGKRPASITINLLADGVKVAEKTVTEADGWAWTFTDLERYDDGREIVYTITEDAVEGYTSTITGMDVTNERKVETVELTGSKTWNDANNQDGKRPASIEINLLADGVEVAEKTVTEADGWAWSFTDLPKYADGKEIVYTITEDAVEGYTAVVTGYNVVNTYSPETTSVTGSKTWNDADNQDGKRPASITINLLADGVEVAEKTVTEADGWVWSFTDLPKYAAGKEIVYTITEDAVEGYTSTVSGYNVVNTYAPEMTSVTGSKTWNDASNQDGKRPASITINLLADGMEVAEKTVTEADNWAWSFTDLPKYAAGKEIVYTITEDAVEGYTAVVSGYNVVNTYSPETTSVTGSKTWNDANNQDGKRPESIVINLLADGVEVAEKTVTEADGWVWSFTDLPKYADGKEIVYTITEDAVDGYTAVVTGSNVVNTYAPETTSVTGSKTWNDASNQDGKRPASIEINLLADGVEVAEKTVTEADGWAWSFTDLPKYADGKEIIYTITEDAVDGYTAVVTGYNVVNTYAPEKTSVTGSKTWNDANNQDGKRPESIVINLLADGVEVAEKTVTEADGWAWSFIDLPKYADGKEILYTITEDAVEGYTAVVTGSNVVNTYSPETTSVTGSKTWNDANNQDGKRPASITINLLADGMEVAEKTVAEADNWAWSFTDLPKYAAGKEIVYTITEDAVEGYTAVVTGYNVVNTYDPETTSVSGSKTWRDDNDRDGVRPASITIRLYAAGEEIASKAVTAADGWKWRFDGLPRYEDGREIVYTITEDPIREYTTMIVDHDVINTHDAETTSVSGMKLWFDEDDAYGVRPESITIHLLANGRRVASKTVTEEDFWEWEFTDLPLNEDGSPIDYTIEEDFVPMYESVVVGYNVFNTYDRTTFSVMKVWEGEAGGEISLTLYADGVRLDPQPEVSRYGDLYIWEDLPLFNDDGEEIVYSATEKYMDGYMTIYDNEGVYADETDRVYEGGTIINRGVVNLFVRKVWADLGEGEVPPPIKLVVYRNGVETDIPMPEPDEHGWYRYYNLPTMVDGEAVRYTVRETNMDGFLAIYTGANGEEVDEGMNGGVITNVMIPATGDDAPLLLWAAMMLAAGAGLLMLRRRRV